MYYFDILTLEMFKQCHTSGKFGTPKQLFDISNEVIAILKAAEPSFIMEQMNRCDWMKNPLYPSQSDKPYLLNEVEGFDADYTSAKSNLPSEEVNVESSLADFWYGVILKLVYFELQRRGFFKH